jgi:ATP-dependent Lhr-like helicase
MDVMHAEEVLEGIEKGEIEVIKLHTDVPSPFAHGIVLIGMSDIVLMEDRKLVLQRLHEQVMKRLKRK